jgi:hypothetical protein
VTYEEASIGGRSDPASDLYPGRRQLDTLSADELRECGAWWFPGPDGHLSGPDPQTVMPIDTSAALDDGSVAFPDGKFLLLAAFCLADGTEFPGHLTFSTDDGGSLREREPTLCTPSGQVPLWHGVLVPDDDDLATWFGWLGRSRDATFPITWRAVFHPQGDELEGKLPGFAVFTHGVVQHV